MDVAHNTSVEIFESKKKAIAEGDDAGSNQTGAAKDIMSILSQLSRLQGSPGSFRLLVDSSTVRANADASEADHLPDADLLGQVSRSTLLVMKFNFFESLILTDLVRILHCFILYAGHKSLPLRVFAFAGTDTTSNTLARILHLLSTHPEVQEKLRAELLDATDGVGDLSYDQLNALPFLDAVCRETLRL